MKFLLTSLMRKQFSWAVPSLLALACTVPSAFASTVALPSGINGFNDPAGFTLNANSNGYLGQDATAHGVPAISSGTLHLTTSQGMAQPGTFFGDERTSAFANQPQNITDFTASFTYQNNGPNPNSQSFGPGDTFIFVLQNDPRGASALGDNGAGYGAGGGTAIAPSAGIANNLFPGFGAPVGPALVTDGDSDTAAYVSSSPVNLVSGDPISVTISYHNMMLSETLVDTLTHAVFATSYPLDLVAHLGSPSAYVGFTGGTGAAVEDQYISHFIFTNNAPPPVYTGPKLVVAATASAANADGQRTVRITTTNTGGVNAGMVTLTSVTLGSATPAAPPASSSAVPTAPNLLAPQMAQTNVFAFSPSPGTTQLVLHVLGTYVDPRNNGTNSFVGSVRLALP